MDTPKIQNIILIDCRGLEFVEFKADVGLLPILRYRVFETDIYQGDWVANGAESTTKFTGIDLSEGDWYDYDEKASEEVSIKEMKWEIKRA